MRRCNARLRVINGPTETASNKMVRDVNKAWKIQNEITGSPVGLESA